MKSRRRKIAGNVARLAIHSRPCLKYLQRKGVHIETVQVYLLRSGCGSTKIEGANASLLLREAATYHIRTEWKHARHRLLAQVAILLKRSDEPVIVGGRLARAIAQRVPPYRLADPAVLTLDVRPPRPWHKSPWSHHSSPWSIWLRCQGNEVTPLIAPSVAGRLTRSVGNTTHPVHHLCIVIPLGNIGIANHLLRVQQVLFSLHAPLRRTIIVGRALVRLRGWCAHPLKARHEHRTCALTLLRLPSIRYLPPDMAHFTSSRKAKRSGLVHRSAPTRATH